MKMISTALTEKGKTMEKILTEIILATLLTVILVAFFMLFVAIGSHINEIRKLLIQMNDREREKDNGTTAD